MRASTENTYQKKLSQALLKAEAKHQNTLSQALKAAKTTH
jgi:hypothetical protein